jgi:putative SOS response-associated peptidase YedK
VNKPMCLRFSLTAALPELYDRFRIDRVRCEYTGQTVRQPRETIPVVVSEEEAVCLDGYTWGIFPFWAKDSINADSGTVREHPGLRRNFIKMRCAIPCDAFYGSTLSGRMQIPVRFSLRDRGVFAVAGIYDVWINPRGTEYRSCSMLTTAPNRLVQGYEDRMPAILEGDALGDWLNPDIQDPDRLEDLLRPFDPERMRAREDAAAFVIKD